MTETMVLVYRKGMRDALEKAAALIRREKSLRPKYLANSIANKVLRIYDDRRSHASR